MNYQDKIWKRHIVLNDLEIALDIYFRSNILDKDVILELIKSKLEDTQEKLKIIDDAYLNAMAPEDPFKD